MSRRVRRVPRWSSLRLRTKGLIVVALPILPLAVLWTLFGAALLRDAPPANTVARSREIQLRLAEVMTALLDAEAAARAALVGDDSEALARQRAAADRVRPLLTRLDGAIIHPDVRAEFERLRAAVDSALEQLIRAARGPTTTADDNGHAAMAGAAQAIATVRRLATTIETRQRALAEARGAESRQRQIYVLAGFLAASIVCTGGGVAAALMLAGGIQQRIGVLSAGADRLARGEPIDETPDGDDEIAQLGLRLREASRLLRQRDADLREANRELEAFSYSVSHDLRAPLRAIDGFSQIIEEDQADRLDDEGRHALQRVRTAARRMGMLIDELLSLARISRVEMRREPVDLTAMVETVAAELARQAPERRVSVTIAPDLIADADPRLLQIAVQNLLHNAWKYTGKVAGARIEIGTTEGKGVRVFHIRDNGAGFDMDHAAKLFGAFQRLHSDRDFEGTGIGLATVQRIVHRHGGRVWAESAVDRGATFFFTLGPEAR